MLVERCGSSSTKSVEILLRVGPAARISSKALADVALERDKMNVGNVLREAGYMPLGCLLMPA